MRPMPLEKLQKGTRVRGLAVEGVATVKSVEFYGQNAVEAIFSDSHGALHSRILTREDEPSLELVEASRVWSFDADGSLFRLASEARRIQLAWLFDPYVAITSSTIEPLPHQISAVYEEMLFRQPMRFLLTDDPGAGKTIMAGLLIKELMIRGDLERCLIISPGSLTEQWQDELSDKFGLEFELLTRDMITAARTANPFETKNLLIARLDQLSRNEDLQERLKAAPEWDLVVCDEAHRMSGQVFGDEIKYTKRYTMGKAVGQYDLSSDEAHLYAEVTEYVRTEMNRAERFVDREATRKVNVGFALMTLQRRLASSPEAIFRSIQRRRERLEARIREEKLVLRGKGFLDGEGVSQLDEDDIDELYDEAPQEEREAVEQKVVDNATAARTIEELEAEVLRLKEIEGVAKSVHTSWDDTKWQELSRILQDPLMTDAQGNRRKLVVFTEFKDNLVAKETREGDVYIRLLTKIEAEREALGGKVFDVLGQLFDKKPLRDLLMEAIRYGSDPQRKADLLRQTDGAVDREHILAIMERRALVQNEMDISKVLAIREDMERAYAKRLQSHFIQSFFLEAFRRLGGTIRRREEGRFEITHVPPKVRERDRVVGTGAPVQARYERAIFDKAYVDDQPRAHLDCPGSPLLDATTSCILDEHVDLLKRGAVLVDEADDGVSARLLFTLEHVVQDGRKGRQGTYNVVSQRLEFVEVGPDLRFRHAGAA
ncbi:MAG: DEAD/DEAH box helicase, partial [Myxococcales bacterium]